MEKVRAWLARTWAKAKVVASSWPGIAAAATVSITALSVEVVPELPGPWPVRVGGWLVAIGGVIRIVSAVVAVVTPVLFPENRGLLAPAPQQLRRPLAGSSSPDHPAPSHVSIHEPPSPSLPPVDPSAYPPGSERLPHRRRT